MGFNVTSLGELITHDYGNLMFPSHTPKAFDQFIVHDSVFGIIIGFNDRLQRLQVGVKAPAIRMRYFLGFATLVMHLIHVVPALLVLQRHLRVIRRRVQVIYHVRHGRNCVIEIHYCM
jgi:hypothetical protein